MGGRDARAPRTADRACLGRNDDQGRFAEAGFAFAFPQMDVHFDSKRPIPVQMPKWDGEGAASG
jgi:hypothetical protein